VGNLEYFVFPLAFAFLVVVLIGISAVEFRRFHRNTPPVLPPLSLHNGFDPWAISFVAQLPASGIILNGKIIMAVPFGFSVGDFVSVGQLIQTIVMELREVRLPSSIHNNLSASALKVLIGERRILERWSCARLSIPCQRTRSSRRRTKTASIFEARKT
jgi:hypothetical protein